MMRFMLPGEGDLKDPYPDSVCWVFFIYVWIPPYRQTGGGGKERLPKAFRQIIDFAQNAGSQLPDEMPGCGVESDEGGAGMVLGGAGPHSKARPS